MKNNHDDAKHPTGANNHPRQSMQRKTDQKDEKSPTNMPSEGKRGTKSPVADAKSGMRHPKTSHK